MNVRIISAKDIKDRKQDLNQAEKIAREIINTVKSKGDPALRYYAEKFDNSWFETLYVSEKEIEEAYSKLSGKEIKAIKTAIQNVKKFALFQKPKPWDKEISRGVNCGVRVSPLDSVGCYIPAGRYPLPPTVIMTVIPAKVAGVKRVIVATPAKNKLISPAILVAADLCGADSILKVGGAQAIAALAYGTESVNKVDKIVGPGNIYVTAAKKLVFGDVGIDMLAGPSEVLIIASKNSNPKFIAADMLAQAEHDELASA